MKTEFAKAFIKMQQELPRIKKEADNPFFKSKYITFDTLVDDTLPIMGKNGFGITQQISNVDGKIALKTTLIHESGEVIEETATLATKTETNPQDYGSAFTYFKRYAWSAILGIAADEDDDGNKVSNKVVQQNNKDLGI